MHRARTGIGWIPAAAVHLPISERIRRQPAHLEKRAYWSAVELPDEIGEHQRQYLMVEHDCAHDMHSDEQLLHLVPESSQ